MMKHSTNKAKVTTIALILTLTFAATFVALPTAVAQQKEDSFAYMNVNPETIGLGQNVLINAWIIPHPDEARDFIYHDFYVTITKPTGTTETLGPYDSYASGTIWVVYTPDQTGTWSAMLSWAGDEYHKGADSPPFKFTVQTEMVPPAFPAVELPEGYWERPINPENREWNVLGGDWLMTRGNSNSSCYQPYSKAPNSAHIVWKKPIGISGLIGGESGSLSYSQGAAPMIVAGRVYYIEADGMHCLDLRTGEELWVVPASGRLYIQKPPGTGQAHIWALGGNFVRYSAETGLETKRTTGIPSPFSFSGASPGGIIHDDYLYMVLTDRTWASPIGHLIKWDLNGRSETFEGNIVWNTTVNRMSVLAQGDVLTLAYLGEYWSSAVNATTGEILWNITRDYQFMSTGAAGYEKFFWADAFHRTFKAYNVYTGAVVWESEPADYPWGGFWAYATGVAYGKVYGLSYDGHVYAFDAETGKTVWKFYSGDTTETPYGHWAFWGYPAIADGKIYAGTSEHTPTQPYLRGNKLYALNAETGDEIWSIAFGGGSEKLIADGYLVSSNEYDGSLYCFGKGKTATTVTASPKVTAKGSTVLIEGTVTDQSPGDTCLGIPAAGTPAIADEYMSEWMEYLYMQKPCPSDLTGVPVHLTAVRTDGEWVDLGTVTSDANGIYIKLWTPTEEGAYSIIASFAGTESYYSSYDATAVGVGPAAEPAGPIEPEPEAPLISTEVAIIAAVAVVAVIGIAAYWILKKRK